MDFIAWAKQLVKARAHGGDSAAAKEARAALKSFADLDHFDDLKFLLSQLTDDGERDGVYWMLESLVRHTGSADVAQFLMDQVGRETNKMSKAALLERIGGLRVEHAGSSGAQAVRIKDASNALACLSERMRHLRTAAIDALGTCSDPRAEEALIRLIDEQLQSPAESGWYLYGAVLSLSEAATAYALPCVLRVLDRIDELPLKTRKGDVEALAVKTAARVGGRGQLDLCCGLLGKKKPPVVKWHAMRALSRHATKKHVPAIKARVQAVLNSKRILPQIGPPFIKPDVGDILFALSEGDEARKTELLWAFEALGRLGALEERDLAERLRKKWSSLTAGEREFLKAYAGGFSDLPDGRPAGGNVAPVGQAGQRRRTKART